MNDAPDEASEEEGGRSRGPLDPLRATFRRFRANLLGGHRFLRARRKRRGEQPRIHGVRYALVMACVVALVAVVFDDPVGTYHGDWSPLVTRVGQAMTNFGRSGWFTVPTGLAILVGYSLDWEVRGRRGKVFMLKWMSLVGYLFVAIAGASLVTHIVKPLIGRARPEHFEKLGAFAFQMIHGYSYYSFPSGHSTTVGALFAAIALLFPRIRLACLVLGLYFGCTRIIVGAHYPSDVAAGLAWGAWFAYFSAMLFARHRILFTNDAQGWPVRRRGFRLLHSERLHRFMHGVRSRWPSR